MMFLENTREWNVDIDHRLNRIIPPSPLHKLPSPVSKFLGYRREAEEDVGNVCGAFWSFVGAFCGLAVVAAVFNNTKSIQWHHPPALIASLGASAVLEYNTIRSPLGQPRNALLGHVISAVIGVGISKLFQMHSDYDSTRWAAGAIACGISSAVMLLTGTVHPPGGASAVLAATDPAITAMGWSFVGLVTLSTTLMLIVGLVINNIQRQFPMYWWTPLDIRKAKHLDGETKPNARGRAERRNNRNEQRNGPEGDRIEINGAGVVLPIDLSLNEEETQVLESLRDRLGKRVDREGGRLGSTRSSAESTVVNGDDTV